MLAFATAALAVERGLAFPRDGRVRRSAVLLGTGLLAVALLAAVRLVAFGAWLPNPATAKSGAFALEHGARYASSAFEQSGTWLAVCAGAGVLVVLADLVRRRATTTSLLVTGLALAALAFVLASGGDWMPGGRLLVMLGPPLALLSGAALAFIAERRRVLAWGVGALLVAQNVRASLAFGESRSNGSYRGDEVLDGERALVGPKQPSFAFSELANRAHRRDARLLGVLLDIVERLAPSAERPVYLMSGQAGMVPYYVLKEHYGRARFIDLYALTSSSALPCMPQRTQRPQMQGIRLSPDYIITHADAMDPSCGLERPQIVFSTGRFPSYLRRHGYVRVYQGPPGMQAFVAVDERVADEPRNSEAR
jgi:hypothetical protein